MTSPLCRQRHRRRRKRERGRSRFEVTTSLPGLQRPSDRLWVARSLRIQSGSNLSDQRGETRSSCLKCTSRSPRSPPAQISHARTRPSARPGSIHPSILGGPRDLFESQSLDRKSDRELPAARREDSGKEGGIARGSLPSRHSAKRRQGQPAATARQQRKTNLEGVGAPNCREGGREGKGKGQQREPRKTPPPSSSAEMYPLLFSLCSFAKTKLKADNRPIVKIPQEPKIHDSNCHFGWKNKSNKGRGG